MGQRVKLRGDRLWVGGHQGLGKWDEGGEATAQAASWGARNTRLRVDTWETLLPWASVFPSETRG